MERYELTADVEALLAALKKHAASESFYTLAYEEARLIVNTKAMEEAQKTLDYKAGEVATSKENVRKARRKTAELINTLNKLGCPEELIQDQWRDHNKKFSMPWPTGHDLTAWLKRDS